MLMSKMLETITFFLKKKPAKYLISDYIYFSSDTGEHLIVDSQIYAWEKL